MTACSGRCGREGAGPIHNGDPARDTQFTWCDDCWLHLMNKTMPPGLVKHLPPGTLVPFAAPPVTAPELNSVAATEHKIVTGGQVKSVAAITARPVTDTGTFTGYLAAFGRDFGGDELMPGSMDETAAALNRGAIQWFLTDSHSEKASDVVAMVTAAVVDHYGLRIAGQWMPDEIAQRLRWKVHNGAKLGLSIDYLTDSSRPDGKGGRLLDRVTVVGGAVTPHPMNPGAFITESKYAASVPVVTVEQSIADGAACRDPDRDRIRREDELLAAVSWPPPSIDRGSRLALLERTAAAKAARDLDGDPERARAQARWDQANRYSSGLAEWMAANR
jgi:hypothetical protein